MVFSDPSTSGLIISYIIPLTGMTGAFFFPMTMLAKSAVSLQRLAEYVNWNHFEKPFDTPKPEDTNWPLTGDVEAVNLSVKYRKELPLVLEGINFKIKSGEKVGIVGRTGSGKSTTLLCLMRILEMAKDESGSPLGYVTVDGQRIDQIGLHQLRNKLAIIPQDPFLFEGSLRQNIDPMGLATDEDIIAALKEVSVMDTINAEEIIEQKVKQIKEDELVKFRKLPKNEKIEIKEAYKSARNYISSTLQTEEIPEIKQLRERGASDMDKLNYMIEERGSNLSVGQRQLICIARAVVKRPRILLMDEATANIDQKTDAIIQSFIKERLGGTTVITIAHRLITIIQYDKLLIFDRGTKAEEGTPLELIQKGGYFAKLVEEGGKEFKAKMIRAAKNHDLDPAVLFG